MFTTNVGLIPIPDHPDIWYLDASLTWVDAEVRITIPAGYITDDASVPKFLDWVPFLDRQGLSRRPGILHDGIYGLGRERGKDFADGILRAACLSEGMSAFQAACYYQGVHLFGTSSWAGDNRVTSVDFVANIFYRTWLANGATIYGSP